jgi:predicted CXXCH cytochrome family protein
VKPKYTIGSIFFGLLIWALSTIWGCNEILNNASNQTTQPFRNLGDSATYVGITACKGCHSDKHSTFIETGMGQSFHLAERKYSKANFKNVKPVYDKKNDLYYYPFWRDEHLYIQEFKLRGRDTIHNRTEKISHIIGSGQHTNSHFWMDGQHLFQAPLTFYTQKGIWDLPPGYEDYNTRFNRKIDIECMSCHTGMPQTKEGSVNIFTKLPLGIDCERCHGPGSLHIKEKTAGIIYNTNKQADYSIVNPKRLPWKLQVDICQRCHLQGNNVLKPGKKFTDFRPGMHLDSIFTVYMPSYKGDAAFVMAGHAERFQMSACFKGSNKGDLTKYNANINFTCINCHNPHVSVKKTNQDRFNQTCIGCHQANTKKSKYKGCGLSEAMRGSRSCVNCHMPSSDTRDIPHVSIHDHYISKTNAVRPAKPIEPTKKTPTLSGLHAVNNPNPNTQELFQAYITYFEKFDANSLYMREAKRLLELSGGIKPTLEVIGLEAQIHFFYNQQLFNDMIGLWESGASESQREALANDAWTQYRMGVAYEKTANLASINTKQHTAKAIQHYGSAVEAMPLNSDFLSEYTLALIKNNRTEEAKSLVLKGLKRQPKHEGLLLNLGHSYYLEKQWKLALAAYEKALALNPNSTAIFTLIDLYLTAGNQKKAKALYLRAKKLGADPKILREWSF